jgi:hypothetical protein
VDLSLAVLLLLEISYVPLAIELALLDALHLGAAISPFRSVFPSLGAVRSLFSKGNIDVICGGPEPRYRRAWPRRGIPEDLSAPLGGTIANV